VGSIFKIILLAEPHHLCLWAFCWDIGCMSGFDTVHWNGEALHGVAGLIIGPLLGLLSALMFSAFFWGCGRRGIVGLFEASAFVFEGEGFGVRLGWRGWVELGVAGKEVSLIEADHSVLRASAIGQKRTVGGIKTSHGGIESYGRTLK